MVFDRTEQEPDEYDPEEELRDPDSDSLTIPQVSTENAGSDLRSDLKAELEEDAATEFSTDDVDPELLKHFWALVLVLNGVILAFSLGLLFLIFDGATTTASYALAAGLVLSGFAIRRYRTFKRQTSSSGSSADSPNETSADDGQADEPTGDAVGRSDSDDDTPGGRK